MFIRSGSIFRRYSSSSNDLARKLQLKRKTEEDIFIKMMEEQARNKIKKDSTNKKVILSPGLNKK